MTQDEVNKVLRNLCQYDVLSQMQKTENFKKLYGTYFKQLEENAAKDLQTFMDAPDDLVEQAYQKIRDDLNEAITDEKKQNNDLDEIHVYETQLETLENLVNAQRAKKVFERFSDEDFKILENAGKSRDDVMKNPQEAKRLLKELRKEESSPAKTPSSAEDKTEEKMLHVSEGSENAPPETKQKGWIELKQEWFNKQKNNLENYTQIYPDESNPNEFKVGFAGGTIHYTSPVDVTISQDADFKLYDILLQDPNNKDAIVDFPQDASEHLTTMLFASAVLNKTSKGKAHQMTNLDGSKINFDLLKRVLTNEQYAELETYTKCQQALGRLSDREKNKQVAAAAAYIRRAQTKNKDVSFEKIIANSSFAQGKQR